MQLEKVQKKKKKCECHGVFKSMKIWKGLDDVENEQTLKLSLEEVVTIWTRMRCF